MEKIRITEDYFDENTGRFEVVGFGDCIDPWYGIDKFEITEEDIKALRCGMILYGDNDEYAMLIKLAERREE